MLSLFIGRGLQIKTLNPNNNYTNWLLTRRSDIFYSIVRFYKLRRSLGMATQAKVFCMECFAVNCTVEGKATWD